MGRRANDKLSNFVWRLIAAVGKERFDIARGGQARRFEVNRYDVDVSCRRGVDDVELWLLRRDLEEALLQRGWGYDLPNHAWRHADGSSIYIGLPSSGYLQIHSRKYSVLRSTEYQRLTGIEKV